MGFAFGGVCYETMDQAVSAFGSSFPKVEGGAVVELWDAVPQSGAPGLFDYSLGQQNIATGAVTSLSGTLGLEYCPDESMGQYVSGDLTLVIAIVVCWALGFGSGLRVQ